MAASSGNENEENNGDFSAENVDIVFMDEDELPINMLAINYLTRDSDEEESDFYLSDSDDAESEQSSVEETIEEPHPRRRKRDLLGTNVDNNNVGSVWKEDITRHADLDFIQYVGPKGRVTGNETPLDVFEMFFTDDVLELITVQTNLYAAQERAKNPEKHKTRWHDVTKDEIKTFLSLNLAMGIVNKPTINSYWSTDEVFQVPFFMKTFSRVRFTQILRYLHFVDNTKLIPRGQDGYDKLGKIRPFMELVIGQFQKMYAPTRNLSIDETLVKFKGRLSWRQFIKDKPARFGLKEFTLADSENGYVLDILVYTGKECAEESKGLAKRVVLKLLEPFYGLGYNIFMDNYYTSVELFEQLYKKKIQACGTCQGNRVGLPHDVTKSKSDKVKKMKRGDVFYRQKDHLTCVTWKDRKAVTVLTTLPASTNSQPVERSVREGNVWRRKEFECPISIREYNSHMGGVDLADQRTTAYARLMKGWTWYLKLFHHLLEVSVLNSYVIYCSIQENGNKVPAMIDFRTSVIKGLHHGRTYRKSGVQAAAEQNTRLNLALGHFPVKSEKRCACKVHVQRVLTPYKCGYCNTYLCPSPCFERFHTLKEYFFSDEDCSRAPPRLKPQEPGRPLALGRPRERRIR